MLACAWLALACLLATGAAMAAGQKRNAPEVGLSAETLICSTQCSDPVYRRGDTTCTDGERNKCLVVEAESTIARLLRAGSDSSVCVDKASGRYRFAAFASVYPEESCRASYPRVVATIAAEAERESRREIDAEAARRAEEESERRRGEAARLAFQSDLRAGKIAPTSLGEFLLKRGGGESMPTLLGAKPVPDGKLYALSGVIEDIHGRSEFTARASNGLAAEASMAFRGQQDRAPTYFHVTVPKSALRAYTSIGRVGLGVFVVGSYVGNKRYLTTNGRTLTMPVIQLSEIDPW